jgi:hypothetical protein
MQARGLNNSPVDLRRYVLGMMRMMGDVRSEGNRRRYGFVESIQIAPFLNIADASFQLLADVSPNLEHLTISSVGLFQLANTVESFETRLHQKHSDSVVLFDRYHAAKDRSENIDHGPDWELWFDRHGQPPPSIALSFPALSTLTLGECITSHPETIFLLLLLAPNLQRLSVKLSPKHAPLDDRRNPYRYRLPTSLYSNTRLVTLRVEYRQVSDYYENFALKTIKDILGFSLQIKRLSLCLGLAFDHDCESRMSTDSIIPFVGDLKELVDLIWQDDCTPLAGLRLGVTGFGSLKRLVLVHPAYELPVRPRLSE